MIEIYCDGSYRKSKECGGFGVCALVPDEDYKSGYRIDFTHSEQEYDTTNNRMEMSALIYAIGLAITKYKNEKCIIYCDSAYCVNMCRDWIWTWSQNGWLNSQNKIVENIDLVYKLYTLLQENSFPNYQIKKILGHSNNLGNDIADLLAKNEEAKLAKILKENSNIFVKYENLD